MNTNMMFIFCLVVISCGKSGGTAGREIGEQLGALEARENWQQQMIENNKRMIDLTRPKKRTIDSNHYEPDPNFDSLLKKVVLEKENKIIQNENSQKENISYQRAKMELKKVMSSYKITSALNDIQLRDLSIVNLMYIDYIKSLNLLKEHEEELMKIVADRELQISERQNELNSIGMANKDSL